MKTLGNPPPGIRLLAPTAPSVVEFLGSSKVLAGKGSLRRDIPSRALAPCAPFHWSINRDGRLRWEPEASSFFVFRKTKTRV